MCFRRGGPRGCKFSDLTCAFGGLDWALLGTCGHLLMAQVILGDVLQFADAGHAALGGRGVPGVLAKRQPAELSIRSDGSRHAAVRVGHWCAGALSAQLGPRLSCLPCQVHKMAVRVTSSARETSCNERHGADHHHQHHLRGVQLAGVRSSAEPINSAVPGCGIKSFKSSLLSLTPSCLLILTTRMQDVRVLHKRASEGS